MHHWLLKVLSLASWTLKAAYGMSHASLCFTYLCVCVCVCEGERESVCERECVCVRESVCERVRVCEKECERQRKRVTMFTPIIAARRLRQRECVRGRECVSVCVWERECVRECG